MAKGRSGFGYAIDYAKAIAEDERVIAYLSSPGAALIGPVADAHLAEYGSPARSILDLCYVDRTLGAKLGISDAALRGMAAWADWQEEPWGAGEPGDYPAAFAAWKTESVEPGVPWERFDPVGEGQRIAWLKRAKASLARHKRNREKFGR